MVSFNGLIAVCLGYVGLLFTVAFLADRQAARGRGDWLRSPLVYTLSLSIYCTAWTFYGAVGYAVRSGMEFVTIYLGPTLVMVGWWWGLRKLVRIGRSQRVTSIADLISARYGKSSVIALAVTLLSVVGITPYIALQLQSITLSFAIFAAPGERVVQAEQATSLATTDMSIFWVAAGLAVFAIMFGTRNVDANERHHGVVTAIALEAVVKLVALLAVGIFVVWKVWGGVAPTLAAIDASGLGQWNVDGGRWTAITFLAAAAFVCLPRMFQVMVVENDDERHLSTAAWAFPLYLLLMSLFVVPIAVAGLHLLPAGSNPDFFVLTVPLDQKQSALATLAFLGGFSSATSMVIVAALALSTMISNHVVMPIWLSYHAPGASVSGDVRHIVVVARRLAIGAVMGLGWLYYEVSGGGAALAAIGLISFAGIAQLLPALVGGLFWRGATRAGALAGLLTGMALWLYTLILPGFAGGEVFSAAYLADGPFGFGWLRPQALFGIGGLDAMEHAVLWSLSLNTLVFVGVSMLTFPSPMERLQGAQFVNVFDHSGAPHGWSGAGAQSEDLMIMAQRILGAADAQRLFASEAQRQGRPGRLAEPNPDFLERLERRLAGSVGAAAAHAMIGQITGGSAVSVEDLMAVASETAQMLEHSSKLEAKSAELTGTAAKLRDANEKLMQISLQKDAFLSQVSHELRTPMTSIRAFSEILRDAGEIPAREKTRYAGIIHDEAVRLTRLLDDLLDLSVLESGQVNLNMRSGTLAEVLDHAVSAALAGAGGGLVVQRHREAEQMLLTSDLDRLAQVFINLISNAQKYCDADQPRLQIRVTCTGAHVTVDFCDNGSGIPPEAQSLIFEKFARVSGDKAGGAGLGLAICNEIMQRLGGDIGYLPGRGGGAFRVSMRIRAEAIAAQ